MKEPTQAKCKFCSAIVVLNPNRRVMCTCKAIGIDVGVLSLTRFLGPEHMLDVETGLPLFPDYKPGE